MPALPCNDAGGRIHGKLQIMSQLTQHNLQMALRIGLYMIAALLLGAHFLRQSSFVAVALCAAAPLLFLYRRRWVPVALQVLAYGASAIWIMTAVNLVDRRQFEGRGWTAAAIILGAVALLTLLAGLLLNSRVIRGRYLS